MLSVKLYYMCICIRPSYLIILNRICYTTGEKYMRRRVLLKSTPMGLPKSMLFIDALHKSDDGKKCTFVSKWPKVNSITVKKCGDYKNLPF